MKVYKILGGGKVILGFRTAMVFLLSVAVFVVLLKFFGPPRLRFILISVYVFGIGSYIYFAKKRYRSRDEWLLIAIRNTMERRGSYTLKRVRKGLSAIGRKREIM